MAHHLPARLDRQLGYFGDARWCLFYYDPRADGVIWKDGRGYGFGTGAWRPFAEHVEPLAIRHGLHLSGGTPDSHVLIIDRRQRVAYFGRRHAAEHLVTTQHQPHGRAAALTKAEADARPSSPSAALPPHTWNQGSAPHFKRCCPSM